MKIEKFHSSIRLISLFTTHTKSIDRGSSKTPKVERYHSVGLNNLQPEVFQLSFTSLHRNRVQYRGVMKKLKDNDLPLPIYTHMTRFCLSSGIEEKEIVKGVKSVLESYGFPTKVSYGDDYSLV